MSDTAPARESWTLPRLGGVAQEPLPAWLVVALQESRITVNRLGGFTDEITGRQCYAGDVVSLGDGGTILLPEVAAIAA